MAVERQVIRVDSTIAADERCNAILDGPGDRTRHVPVHPVVNDQKINSGRDCLLEGNGTRIYGRADFCDPPRVRDLEAVERARRIFESGATRALVAV